MLLPLQVPVSISAKCKICISENRSMFLADVTGVQVSSRYMNENGKFELNKTGLLAYSHGEYLGLGKKIGTFVYSVRKKKKK